MNNDLSSLMPVLHRRWTVPILARLADPETGRTGKARSSALAAHLGIPRRSVAAVIGELSSLGLLEANPGHGHPLRPELLLTAAGKEMGPGFLELDRRLGELELRDIGYRKWSLPTLAAIGEGPTRFGEIRSALSSSSVAATDRAISLSLGDLYGSALIERTVVNAAPPRPEYAAARAAEPIVRTTRALAGALSAL